MIEAWGIKEVKNVVKDLVPKDIESLADFGVGSGELVSMIKKDSPSLKIKTLDFVRNVGEEVDFVQADFNEEFFIGEKFDCVVSTEVIEHLENPYKFLRVLSTHTSSKGCVIVSTPSIVSKRDKKYFNENNAFWYFNEEFEKMCREKDKYDAVHITPILPYYLEVMFKRAGLVNLEWYSELGYWDKDKSEIMIVRGWKE